MFDFSNNCINAGFEKEPAAESPQVTLIISKSNLPTLKVGDYLLHSSYDPVKEAKRLAELHYKKNHLHILFGLGLGYLAKELFARMGESDLLLIVEPNREVINFALEDGNLDNIINSRQVIMNNGHDLSALENILNFFMKEGYLGKTNFIESPNYLKLYPDLAREIIKLLKESSMLELINVNTLHAFAQIWQKNYLLNLYHTVPAKPFSSLAGRLSCPVIIAAAGPSLSKQLPLLRSIQNRALILCAGSAINSLLQGGVIPHAVVTVDGGEANYRHFKELSIDSIPIIYSLFVHREIPNHHRGTQVIFNDTNSKLTQWTDQALGRDLGSARGGQSVANYCFDIACQMGSGPVCFVGQDLAYTNNMTHAPGNIFNKELDPDKIVNQVKYTMVKGYYEDSVLTDYVFLGMKITFEHYIAFLRQQGDNRHVINATEGGAMIEGAQNMPLKDFIRLYCCDDHTENIASLFHNNGSDSTDWRYLYKSIQKEKENLLHIIELCQKAKNEFKKIRSYRNLEKKILIKLDRIDEKLKSLLENNLMHYVLQPVIFRVQYRYPELQNETKEDRNKRVLTKSEALYNEIKEAAEYTEKCINELIDKIKSNYVV